MKKFALFLFLSVITSVAHAIPLLFEEGKHYQVISDKVSDSPNVTEFFSFYCQHCFRFEPLAKDIEKALPENVTFKKSHVEFMRNVPQNMQQTLSRAIVLASKLDNKDKIVADIFAHIHTKKIAFDDDKDVENIFLNNGVDNEFYQKQMKSFSVKSAAKNMSKAQKELSRRRILTAVPMFIVNNKYKILAEGLSSKEDYLALVSFLLKLDS